MPCPFSTDDHGHSQLPLLLIFKLYSAVSRERVVVAVCITQFWILSCLSSRLVILTNPKVFSLPCYLTYTWRNIWHYAFPRVLVYSECNDLGRNLNCSSIPFYAAKIVKTPAYSGKSGKYRTTSVLKYLLACLVCHKVIRMRD